MRTVDLFDSRPAADRARELRHTANRILRRDLERAVGVSSKALPTLAGRASNSVAALDPNRLIAPAVYGLYWRLMSGIRSQDITLVATALSDLGSLPTRDGLFTDTTELGTLRGDICDLATADYLYGAAGPRGDNGELPEMLPVPQPALDRQLADVGEALSLIRTYDDGMFGEISELVTSIRVIQPRHLGSISTPRSFGLMHIRPPFTASEKAAPPLCYVERITHETSHISLNGLMLHDPLVLNPDTDRFPSPLREDPRPMSGIYHAVFVLSRLVRVFASIAENPPQNLDRDALTELHSTAVSTFRDGYRTVSHDADLTEAGRAVLESCAMIVREASGRTSPA